MASTTFVDGTTPINAAWLNDVNRKAYVESVSVKDFGAIGDGVADDAAAIPACCTAITTSGGGRIFFPSGTFRVTTGIIIGSNTMLLGAGKSSVILAAQTGFVGSSLISNINFAASSLTDAFIQVQNLAFDYGAAGTGGDHAIDIRMASHVTIANCFFNNGGDATAFRACKDTLVQGCFAYGFSNCAYDHWEGPQSAKVISCYAETSSTGQMVNFNPEATNPGSGYAAKGFILSNCILTYNGSSAAPIQIEPLQTGNTVADVIVSNNVFNNCILAMRGAVSNSQISGNIFENILGSNFVIGSFGQFGGTPANINLIGNILVNPLTTGANQGAIFWHVNGYTMSGNIITGALMYASVDATGGSGLISNNIFPAGTSGADIVGSAAGYAAWIAPTFTNSWVNYGGAFLSAGYYKDQANVVHLRGCIKSGSLNTAAFVLPVHYAPSAAIQIAVPSAGAFGYVQITSGGGVYPSGGSTTQIFLDGISFRAD